VDFHSQVKMFHSYKEKREEEEEEEGEK